MGEAKRRKKLDPNYGKPRNNQKLTGNFRNISYYPDDYDLFMETAKDFCSDLVSENLQRLESEALKSNKRGFVFVEMSDFYENQIDIMRGQKNISSLSKINVMFFETHSLCKNLLPEDKKNKSSLPNRVCPILENYDLSEQFYILFNFSEASDFYDNDCYYFLSFPMRMKNQSC